jgi:hypothetical protein
MDFLSLDTYNGHKKVCATDSELGETGKHSPNNGAIIQTHYFNRPANFDCAINDRRKLTYFVINNVKVNCLLFARILEKSECGVHK